MKKIQFVILMVLLASFAYAVNLDLDCPASVNPSTEFTCKASISPSTDVTNVKFTVVVPSGFTLVSVTPLGGLTGPSNIATGVSSFISGTAEPLNLGDAADIKIKSGASGSGTVTLNAVKLMKDDSVITSSGSSATVTIQAAASCIDPDNTGAASVTSSDPSLLIKTTATGSDGKSEEDSCVDVSGYTKLKEMRCVGNTLTSVIANCPSGKKCEYGACALSCVPQCTDKVCGPDSCGGSCGTCSAGNMCNEIGACEPIPSETEIEISSCLGNSGWTSGKTYKLTQDLNFPLGNCFVPNVNDVTIDCQGYSITGGKTSNEGTTQYGIMINNVNKVAVKNCKISKFSYGITVDGSMGSNLISNEVKDNFNGGITIQNSPNAYIDSNTACSGSQSYYDFSCFSSTSLSGKNNIFGTISPSNCDWPKLNTDYTICASAKEICGDNLDNDGDGKLNCDDEDCIGINPCISPPTQTIGERIDEELESAGVDKTTKTPTLSLLSKIAQILKAWFTK